MDIVTSVVGVAEGVGVCVARVLAEALAFGVGLMPEEGVAELLALGSTFDPLGQAVRSVSAKMPMPIRGNVRFMRCLRFSTGDAMKEKERVLNF
jgi:hypothetical protein